MKVFISHSSKDKKFVRHLKDCLLENTIETWLDEDQLEFGDSLVTKLENALDETSHLVIILSPASIESDWVKFELKKALINQKTGLTQKIIPIKYRDCKIPDELSDLLYADLSEEVVLPTDSNRVKFISNGFDSFFLKLVRGIRNSGKIINKDEKEEIIKSIKSSEKDILKNSSQIHRGIYELVGFASAEARNKYQNIIMKESPEFKNIENIRPILLPLSLKTLFSPKIGDVIEIQHTLPFPTYGHFAGFRLDDLKITIEKEARNGALLDAKHFYQVEVDTEKRLIKFVNKIK